MNRRPEDYKPVITELFPIAERVALKSIFSMADELTSLSGVELSHEACLFSDQNPESFNYLYSLAQGFRSPLFGGMLLGHRVLRTAAEEQFGRLPFLHRGFIPKINIERQLSITLLAEAFNMTYEEAKGFIDDSKLWSIKNNERVLDDILCDVVGTKVEKDVFTQLGNGL